VEQKSRLYKISLFSTGRHCDVTQAALTHIPAHASASLAQGPGRVPPLKTGENFIMSVTFLNNPGINED
jgi:hypothetical protein